MTSIDQVIANGPFQASWDSLKDYTVPDWYEDGKFGIFIHWGLYAVPAFSNEWYPRNMYLQGSVRRVTASCIVSKRLRVFSLI